MFLAPNFFGGRAPELLDLHYKADPDCDHVAKIHGDRPRELGDLVANGKQESPAVADKPARRLRKVCTVYVRAVGL